MDKKLFDAISEMLDAASYAIDKLERYTDYDDDKFSHQLVPNDALSAQSCLKEAFNTLDAMMEGVTVK